MEEKKSSSLLGIGLGATLVAGAALGAVATSIYKEKHALKSKEILDKVKAHFLKEGAIEVAYIGQEKERYSQFAIQSEVLRGGIVRKEDVQFITYEFLADVLTGVVVSVERKEVEEFTC